jgi:hypothetical protein
VKKYPIVWQLDCLIKWSKSNRTSNGNNYYPVRPFGWPSLSSRVQIAWLVFTGRADAVIWPGDQ